MKKSLLALAVLGAFAGAASAQSSVVLYGRVDVSLARPLGSSDLVMQNGSGSRFGVRGTEDLGGGLKALFQIEHRFNADTGVDSNAAGSGKFWHARTIVGLSSGPHAVHLGRDYTPGFLWGHLLADPWGWDTVAANNAITGGLISPVRADNAITYWFSQGAIAAGAQFALKEAGSKNGYSLVARYSAGPIMAAVTYERPVNTSADWMTILGSYNLGPVKLGALFGDGESAAGNKHRSMMVSAVAPLGAGELRFSVGQLKNRTANVTVQRPIAVGYHYFMSKRTTFYADIVNDTKRVTSNKTGFDVGIKHNF